MSILESFANFNDLTVAFITTEIDCRANCRSAHIICLLYAGEHDLIKFIRVCKKFVMVNFYYERNFMSIFS